MMLKKMLSCSSKKILKAIKNVSRAKLSKKLEQQRQQVQAQTFDWLKGQELQAARSLYWTASWAWPALDELKGRLEVCPMVETAESTEESHFCCCYCCCYCCDDCERERYSDEREENQRNENLENDML